MIIKIDTTIITVLLKINIMLLRQARMPSWWEFVMAVLNDQLLDDHWRPMLDFCSVNDDIMIKLVAVILIGTMIVHYNHNDE